MLLFSISKIKESRGRFSDNYYKFTGLEGFVIEMFNKLHPEGEQNKSRSM